MDKEISEMTTRKPDSMFGSKSSITRSDIERAMVKDHGDDLWGEDQEADVSDVGINGPRSTPGFELKLGNVFRSSAPRNAGGRQGTSP